MKTEDLSPGAGSTLIRARPTVLFAGKHTGRTDGQTYTHRHTQIGTDKDMQTDRLCSERARDRDRQRERASERASGERERDGDREIDRARYIYRDICIYIWRERQRDRQIYRQSEKQREAYMRGDIYIDRCCYIPSRVEKGSMLPGVIEVSGLEGDLYRRCGIQLQDATDQRDSVFPDKFVKR